MWASPITSSRGCKKEACIRFRLCGGCDTESEETLQSFFLPRFLLLSQRPFMFRCSGDIWNSSLGCHALYSPGLSGKYPSCLCNVLPRESFLLFIIKCSTGVLQYTTGAPGKKCHYLFMKTIFTLFEKCRRYTERV